MNGIHPLDLIVIAIYFGVILFLGKRASSSAGNEEGFFLAGRKLGKVYQFFLNFGNATDVNGAVSTASLVYRQGVSGVWLAFQTIFMNPYYWFMNMWFRRVRLVTMAELFEERLESPGLARTYAMFQIAVAIMTIGWGNLLGYKVTASLMPKPVEALTIEERAKVQNYQDWRKLEGVATTPGALSAEERVKLEKLRDLAAHGELQSFISYIKPFTFYIVFTFVVGLYIVMGGMAATAKNEIFQGLLIVIFSIMLIPFGLHALGGLVMLRQKVPPDMFKLLGTSGGSQFTWYSVVAILFVSIIQINGIVGNMGVSGSAKDEYAARFGAVSGTYAKRVMIIMWAFVGLVAVGLYQGANQLSDPDIAWGVLSKQLLGPGFFGLMLAGVLAAKMSSLATQSMAISALFVRNVYSYFAPERTESRGVFVGRITIAAVLIAGIGAALIMDDIVVVIKLILTVNVPFGAAVFLMFFWRRLTAAAVWWCVILSVAVLIVAPFFVQYIPSLNKQADLVASTQPATLGTKPTPLFFETVARANAADLTSPLAGRGRFNVEAWMLSRLGWNMNNFTANDLLSVQFYFDGLFPFLVLIGLSLVTRAPERSQVDQFFGRMKTQVGATPELEEAVMAETRRNPRRFDHLKIFPHSSWEFTRWDRVDTVGFIACCGVSAAIIALFWLLLRIVS